MDTWHIPVACDDAYAVGRVAAEISELVERFNAEPNSRVVSIWELRGDSDSIGRSTLQIPVDIDFFEWFFNSDVGYRAMFRRGRRVGSAANGLLIDAVRASIQRAHPEEVLNAILVEKKAEGLVTTGLQHIPRQRFLRSLDPSLSKVWYATQEIAAHGIRNLSFGVSEGKIDVGLENTWSRIAQDRDNCIIEVKGAFVAPTGLFQTKDPEARADGLFASGSA